MKFDEKGRRVITVPVDFVCISDEYIDGQGHKCSTLIMTMAGATISTGKGDDKVVLGSIDSALGYGTPVVRIEGMTFYLEAEELWDKLKSTIANYDMTKDNHVCK